MGWIFFQFYIKLGLYVKIYEKEKGHLLLGKRKVALERSSEKSRESSNGSSNIQCHFNWCLTCWTSGILKKNIYILVQCLTINVGHLNQGLPAQLILSVHMCSRSQNDHTEPERHIGESRDKWNRHGERLNSNQNRQS